MTARTLRILEAVHFGQQQSRGIAEAIDNAFAESAVVTVPILDVRLSQFRHEMKTDVKDLEAKIIGTFDQLFYRLIILGAAGTAITVAVIDFVVLKLPR